jgi:hypothetical protein
VVQPKLHITGLYALRRLKAARATKKRSRAAPFVRFFSATFLRLLETYGFLYRNRKNFAYSRNVMRNGKFKYRKQKLGKLLTTFLNRGS